MSNDTTLNLEFRHKKKSYLEDVQKYSDYEGPRTTDGLNNFVSGVLNKMPDNAAQV